MAPGYLNTSVTFCGQPCGRGVNSRMAALLTSVEAELRQIHAYEFDTGETTDDFEIWSGVHEPLIGWRSGHGYHASGSAVDINYSTVPYIVTRTGSTLGGEAAAAPQREMRQRTVEVYDRAVAFVSGPGATADVSIRVHDTIEYTYDRFRDVSDAIVSYLSWAVSTEHTRVDRPPIPNVHLVGDGDPAFNAIANSELDNESHDSAIALLDRLLATDPTWAPRAAHYGSGAALYWQMLRDYEIVRTPMLFGNPAQPITATRNPAHGFLDLRKELVVAMIRTGDALGIRVRWGASDFGARESGDVMHFDLGHHAAAPS